MTHHPPFLILKLFTWQPDEEFTSQGMYKSAFLINHDSKY